MPPPHIPLKELGAAVESAVQQVLEQHGKFGLEHIWVGFVAPDAIATLQNAQKIGTQLGRGAGVTVQPSVAQLGAGGAAISHTETAAGTQQQNALPTRGHIIGIVYQPNVKV